MNNNLNKIKYWNLEEENQLINEINNLENINNILKNHDRKITGIIMRIEKIINDPTKSKNLINIEQITEKYLKNSKPTYLIDYNELYLNILKFNSLQEISSNYNNVSESNIINVLNNLLNRENIDVSKKLRIKCLLNNNDNLEFAKNIYKEKNNNSNTNTNAHSFNNNFDNNSSNINSIIICLLNEFKSIKIDLFDINNRIKIIMEKICKIEKQNLKYEKNNKNEKSNNNYKTTNITEYEQLNSIPIQSKTENIKIINDDETNSEINSKENNINNKTNLILYKTNKKNKKNKKNIISDFDNNSNNSNNLDIKLQNEI